MYMSKHTPGTIKRYSVVQRIKTIKPYEYGQQYNMHIFLLFIYLLSEDGNKMRFLNVQWEITSIIPCVVAY